MKSSKVETRVKMDLDIPRRFGRQKKHIKDACSPKISTSIQLNKKKYLRPDIYYERAPSKSTVLVHLLQWPCLPVIILVKNKSGASPHLLSSSLKLLQSATGPTSPPKCLLPAEILSMTMNMSDFFCRKD
jgi:hypothetical protein